MDITASIDAADPEAEIPKRLLAAAIEHTEQQIILQGVSNILQARAGVIPSKTDLRGVLNQFHHLANLYCSYSLLSYPDSNYNYGLFMHRALALDPTLSSPKDITFGNSTIVMLLTTSGQVISKNGPGESLTLSFQGKDTREIVSDAIAYTRAEAQSLGDRAWRTYEIAHALMRKGIIDFHPQYLSEFSTLASEDFDRLERSAFFE